MTTVVRHGDRLVALVKGAPEWVLRAQHALPGRRRRRSRLDAGGRARRSQAYLRDSAGQAMRTLAFGLRACCRRTRRPTEDGLHARGETLESGLVFAGFVAIRDPLREDVKEAVDRCRAAGIEVKMITGDNVETARAIAFDIGLSTSRDAPIDARRRRGPDQPEVQRSITNS